MRSFPLADRATKTEDGHDVSCPYGGRAAGAKKQQVPRCARDDIRGSGEMFPATLPVLKSSHDPSTARPDASATLRAGVQTTHAENASVRSAQDDRQGGRRVERW